MTIFIASGNVMESQRATSSSVQWSKLCHEFEFSEILLATQNFDESLVIGQGGFGKVYRGNIKDGSSLVVAAVKRLDPMSNQGATEFWAEVEMLSKLRHCNLVSLFGYCKYEKEMILVYEYMPNGTLEDHLHKLRTPLPWLERLKICISAARGLDYLHTGFSTVNMADRERFKPNVWYDVPPKKNRNNVQHQNSNASSDGVKFFVSNLPEGCSSSDLKDVLSRYGDVQGVYIARKYDKLGKRFGFATFKVTRNRVDLEANLKDVWIGSYKLFIVPARFVSGQKPIVDKGKKIDNSVHREAVWKPVTGPEVQVHLDNQNEEDRMHVDGSSSEGVDQRSFRDTLLNKNVEPSIPEVIVQSEGKNLHELYGSGVIAKVSSLDVLTSIKSKLKEAAFGGCNIRYLGGFTVMLNFENASDKDRFLNVNDVWKTWFTLVEPWNGQVVMTDRVAWLKIRGLPAHVAEMKVFNDIAGVFGTVIAEAQYPEEGDISYAVVGVSLQSQARVVGYVKAVWRDNSYLVYVEEDTEEWVPNCVADLGDESEVLVETPVEEPAYVVYNVSLPSEEVPVRQTVEEQEVLPHLNGHFDDSVGAGSTSKSCKRKGGKYSKKKGVYRRSMSPLDKDRPKKRVREDNDMFDIDRFIFVNPVQVEADNSNIEQVQQEEFIIPDLNGNVESNMVLEGNSNSVENRDEVRSWCLKHGTFPGASSECGNRREFSDGGSMNVMSINIRGMGRVDKAGWISNVRVANEVCFVMFQESQLVSMQNVNLDRFWGRGEYEAEWVEATGRSGGIVSMWDKKVFQKLSVLKHRNILVVHGIIKSNGMKVGMVNVYAPQKIDDKRVVWKELERIIRQDSSLWIVGGDFNCVRDRSERKSSKFDAVSSNEFNDFLDDLDLHEYGLQGRKFTFVAGNKCSRIDRIFVSLNFVNEWPNAEYRALPRGKSDHSPLILKVEYRNFGPKPFKFFNSWLDREGFEEMIVSNANRFYESSCPDLFLLHKLKFIRRAIVEWKSRFLKLEEEEVQSIRVDLEELDMEVETRDLREEEQWVYCEGNRRLREIEIDEIGKIHWVAWDKVARSKALGGLGLNRLLDCNYSMMFKWIWRYKVEENVLWKRVIEALHVSNRRWDMIPWNKQSSGPWSKIVKTAYATQVQGTRFINMIRGTIGNGLDIRFWLDTWISDEPLKDLFPSLFRLERNKWCKVADRLGNANGGGVIQWEWKRYPALDDETRELIECHRLVTAIRLNQRNDSWRWNSGSNVTYTVKEARKWLRNEERNPIGDNYKWCKWLPSKCNVFMWRTSLDRIPTANNLARRNINMGDGSCRFCGEADESTDHIFTACMYTNGLWNGLVAWLKIPPMLLFSVKDILRSIELLPLSSSRKEIIYGILIIMCWKIWVNRNEIIFKQGKAIASKLMADVKAISFLWFNSRSKKDKPFKKKNTLVKGTFGYLDPNYFTTGRLTRKSDVYAFGVVLFEVLCRKRAVDRTLDEDQWGLVTWVQDAIKEGNLKCIIDSDISNQISSKCLKEFVQIAEGCLHSHPKHRPTMAEVVVSLNFVLTLQEKTNSSLQPAGRTMLRRMVEKIPFASKGESSASGDPKISSNHNDVTRSASNIFLDNDECPADFRILSPSMKVFKFSQDSFLGWGGFGEVFLGWINKKTFAPSKRGVGIVVAVKRRSALSFQGHAEWLKNKNPRAFLHNEDITTNNKRIIVIAMSSSSSNSGKRHLLR
ncbi:RNA-directed DNA polymerase, eukaryota, Nucleotide-binding alpha-beta plait domain protein [Artemisia annua]|uniref:RNA-directed DNA polymerase, eukaryota, Nucleotide-binding alpha-beta plait domain protein n=1 Tax=Artemisia annua TaxID=35608 RepID=A0A2U1NQQ1_ARTAN|nr:RNA-directed DNA polymerase, eukaryota, Nucleotide-binding alpha-beta plait domain protein [Artemisia annua]